MFIATKKKILAIAIVDTMKKKHLSLIKNTLSEEERMLMRFEALKRDLLAADNFNDVQTTLDIVYNYLADIAGQHDEEHYYEDLIMSVYKIKEASFYLASVIES
jgi:hypothetical protein